MKVNKTLKKMSQSKYVAKSGDHYSCMECDWDGEASECDFDFDFDEFKGIDIKYPICPKCGSGLDC